MGGEGGREGRGEGEKFEKLRKGREDGTREREKGKKDIRGAEVIYLIYIVG